MSEAASVRSERSERSTNLDDEQEDDNLSDMVSANVSGRGEHIIGGLSVTVAIITSQLHHESCPD